MINLNAFNILALLGLPLATMHIPYDWSADVSLRTGGDDRPWRRCYVRFNSTSQIHSSLFPRSFCRHL